MQTPLSTDVSSSTGLPRGAPISRMPQIGKTDSGHLCKDVCAAIEQIPKELLALIDKIIKYVTEHFAGGATPASTEANPSSTHQFNVKKPEEAVVIWTLFDLYTGNKEKSVDTEGKIEAKAEPEKGTVEWFNSKPVSLNSLGSYHNVEQFLMKHGKELTSLNLRGLELNDIEFAKLIKYCPNVQYLRCNSALLSDQALEDLPNLKQLKSINFSRAADLTDKALSHLKGMQLERVYFADCDKLTDAALSHLEGMSSLYSAIFDDCSQITQAKVATLNKSSMRSRMVDAGPFIL